MPKFTLSEVKFDARKFECNSITFQKLRTPQLTALMLEKAGEARVKRALGGWPENGKSVATKAGRLIWFAKDQALLFGVANPSGAASVDISDGWVFFEASGDRALALMERLAPIDFRKMSEGDVVRTLALHQMVIIIRSPNGFEIGVMSSFADDAEFHLRHEISML